MVGGGRACVHVPSDCLLCGLTALCWLRAPFDNRIVPDVKFLTSGVGDAVPAVGDQGSADASSTGTQGAKEALEAQKAKADTAVGDSENALLSSTGETPAATTAPE